MPDRQPYIVAYDIPASTRRRVALRIALARALTRQHSVFECPLAGAEHETLLRELAQVLETNLDRLLVVRALEETPRLMLGRATHRADNGLCYVG